MFRFLIRTIKQNKKFIKFGISGCSAAIVDFSLLFYLHGVVGLELRESVVIAFVLAFFVSFYLQKFWTFKDGKNKKTKRQMAMFFAVGVFNTGINALVVPWLTQKGLYYLLSQAVSMGVLSIGSFIMYNFVIFKKSHKNLKKKNLFLPDKFNGLRVLVATFKFCDETIKLRSDLKNQGDRVKVATYKEDLSGGHGVYSINTKAGMFGKAFDYYYHMYKIANWADVVYLFANHQIIIPAFVACKLKNLPYILEIDNSFVLGSMESFIVRRARIVVIRDESLLAKIRNIGVRRENIIVLNRQENLKIAEYLL